mgnify:CR=1 FL=1
MIIYDLKINSLEHLPKVKNLPIISDCDGTLFEHGTTKAYPDVEQALGSASCLALVSAHPDEDLMQERQQLLGADIAISSSKPTWYKGKLFSEVASNLAKSINKAVILGDRPVADVGIAKMVFAHHKIDTLGVRIDRPNQPIPSRIDYLLKPTYAVCKTIVKISNQETRFRPNFVESLKLAEDFLE